MGTDVYIFNINKLILRELKKISNPLYIHRAQKHKIKYGSIRAIWNYITTLFSMTYIAAKITVGAIGIGDFILYYGTIFQFINGISDIAYVFGRLIQNNEPLEKLFKFLDIPNENMSGLISIDSNMNYEIEFCNVSFRYPNRSDYALKNISIKFNLDDVIAIVGKNGSGKTTFIKLLCRLYTPTSGKILLNGIDINDYKYDEYIALFSTVFQDYKLFSFSIGENIAASDTFDVNKVLLCLKLSGLGDKMKELENNVNISVHTDYSKDGIDFSGGECQKIAIARALYKNSPFILLDEPTAALDPISEAEIYEKFKDISTGRFVLYISHRLSSCRFCDKIFVFDDGQIVQVGNHSQLMLKKGVYSDLWEAQSKHYIQDEYRT